MKSRTFQDADGCAVAIDGDAGQIWLAGQSWIKDKWVFAPVQAREIAAHLIALADEIEGKTDPRVFAPVPDFGFDSEIGSADTVEVQR